MNKVLFSLVAIWFSILILASNTFAQDYTQWSLPEGAKARLGKGSMDEIAYSPDGTRLAVASSIGIWLYDTQTGEALDLLTGHTSGARSVSFSPNGKTLASASWDQSICLWDAQTGTHLRTMTKHTRGVESVTFSPDGKMLASASYDKTVCLWDVRTGTHIRTLEEHTEIVYSVSFSPDGKTLASGSEDKTVRCGIRRQEHLFGHSQGIRNVSIVYRSVRMEGHWQVQVMTRVFLYGMCKQAHIV